MVKTTFEIKDEIYRKLVEASVKKYGNTKNLSRITNEIIEEHLKEKPLSAIGNSRSEDEEIKRRLEIVRRSAGSWTSKGSGAGYTRKIRKGWEKRLKNLGL